MNEVFGSFMKRHLPLMDKFEFELTFVLVLFLASGCIDRHSYLPKVGSIGIAKNIYETICIAWAEGFLEGIT
jgi:uncharacterized membrane protein